MSPRIYHTLKFYEWRGFQNPDTELVLNEDDDSLVVGCVSISRQEQTVRTEFCYDANIAGMPDRGSLRKVLTIGLDGWSQTAYNGRFSRGRYDDVSYWRYAKVVVNVGLFSELTADVFTRSQPAATFRSMESLF